MTNWKDWLAGQNQRPKLLVVDDQAVNIQVIYALFKKECDIFMATSGPQAIAQCKTRLPDLILLDVVMPDMDGHEVCRTLKADPLTSHIPIIFLTSKRNESDEAQGLLLGAVDFISKPVNDIIVRARVQTHFALKLQSDMLKAIAVVDGLTGIWNRRHFDEELSKLWQQCTRAHQPLSIAMIDVDHFKQYNDCYGHQMGDECLKKVARALKETHMRPSDFVARYGGEEFAVLMPDTPLEGAVHVVNRLLSAVQELNIPHERSSAASTVSVSVGVACGQPNKEWFATDLLASADLQLYAAKHQGRARHCAMMHSVDVG